MSLTFRQTERRTCPFTPVSSQFYSRPSKWKVKQRRSASQHWILQSFPGWSIQESCTGQWMPPYPARGRRRIRRYEGALCSLGNMSEGGEAGKWWARGLAHFTNHRIGLLWNRHEDNPASVSFVRLNRQCRTNNCRAYLSDKLDRNTDNLLSDCNREEHG